MIQIENLTYRIGDFSLKVSLHVGHDEYFVLFGQTGCGKTSLVECICGLRPVSGGRIKLGGADVTELAPRERDVGYVPQDGALFEHLNVFHNIAFPLRVRRISRTEQRRAVESSADKLHIRHLLDRKVLNLSGGERQRVAIARALVIRPRLMLLDEPVSALDEPTRDLVCEELSSLQRRTNIPVIHVCHSFEEARMVGDAIGVMRGGRLVQVGRPVEQAAEEPADGYVARVLGLWNVFSGRAVSRNGRTVVEVEGTELDLSLPEGPVEFMIRPWCIYVGGSCTDRADNVLAATVRRFSRLGAVARLEAEAPMSLTVHLHRDDASGLRLEAGDTVYLCFSRQAAHLLSSQ